MSLWEVEGNGRRTGLGVDAAKPRVKLGLD